MVFWYFVQSAAPAAPLVITNSIIVDPLDSEFLFKTPSTTTSTTTWTVSCWVKRANIGSVQNIFSANNGGDAVHTGAWFTSSDILVFNFGGAAGAGLHGDLRTTALFRDPAAWLHLVFVADVTNATASDRMRIYVNGVRITDFGTEELPNQNLATGHWNTNTKIHRIAAGPAGIEFFDGYIAEVNAVDGQALTASSFGTNIPEILLNAADVFVAGSLPANQVPSNPKYISLLSKSTAHIITSPTAGLVP